MKKTLVAAAVLAGLSGAANAVVVNPDGLGQVLIYPYYTVEGDQNTLLSVVNTTTQVKAVKVRFLESLNSREVLDFNLYLSPEDVWTGAVVADDAGGAKIVTTDISCTVPAIPAGGEPFRKLAYETDPLDGGIERTREGYVEMIEMGVVTGVPAFQATHGAGQDCAALSAYWAPGGTWDVNPGFEIEAPTGGLFGGEIIIDVPGAAAAGNNAVALNAFSVLPSHTDPGFLNPNLNDAFPPSSVINDAVTGAPISDDWATGIDAVSAVLAHASVVSEYLASDSFSSDWVVTMPTKWGYVDFARAVGGAQGGPGSVQNNPEGFFSSTFQWPNGACEQVSLKYWDREENTPTGDIDFSPKPIEEGNFLCYEANVVTFNGTDALQSVNSVNINAYDEGWMRMRFVGGSPAVGPTSGHVYHGLPVVGFGVTEAVNNEDGNKNYGAAHELRFEQ